MEKPISSYDPETMNSLLKASQKKKEKESPEKKKKKEEDCRCHAKFSLFDVLLYGLAVYGTWKMGNDLKSLISTLFQKVPGIQTLTPPS